MVHGNSYEFLVFLRGSLWFLVIFYGSLWFLIILGGFWWFLDICFLKRMTDCLNESLATGLVEQPLALPGPAKYGHIDS